MTPDGMSAALTLTRQTLDNGIVVLVQPTTTTPAVSINLALEAGSLFDPADALGTAYFLSRVIDRGTQAQTADEIAEVLDASGVSLSVSVSRHAFGISCTCLSEDFEQILKVITSIIRESTVPAEEVATRRGEVLTALQQAEDNPATRSIERLMAMLYGEDHPYGRRSKGSPESVGRIDRDALVEFHRMRIVPDSLSLVVVGDVTSDTALDAASAALGSWQASGGAAPTLDDPPVATERRQDLMRMPGKSQADIAYGFTTIARDDSRYHPYTLMANIFGQYGMGGRLGHSIREQQGMAYYAFCSFEASRIAGPLVVRAGVNGANVDRAIESIDREVARMTTDGVTERELQDAQRYLVGSLPRTLETNAGIAGFLQNVERFDLGLDYAQRVPGLIEAVTRDQVNAAAAEALDSDRAMVAVAGP